MPNLMAFNYNSDAKAYVTGSLVDAVTAVLFVLGLGLAIARIRRPAYRLIIVWWLITMAVTGFANPRAEIAMTRLFFALPPVAALAGLALHECLTPLQRAVKSAPLASAALVVVLFALMTPVVMLNLNRAWDDPHKRIEAEALAVGAVVSDECEALPRAAVVTSAPDNLPLFVFGARRMGNREPNLVSYDDALSDGTSVGAGYWPGCVVLIPDGDEAVYTQVINRFSDVYGERSYEEVKDPSDFRRIYVWR